MIEDLMRWKGRRMVLSRDLNGAGTLFGGRMLEWIDEESAIFAACQLENSSVVTAHMSEINFVNSAHLGDVIEIGCEIIDFGTTSISLSCVARNKQKKHNILTVDKIVFVCVDLDGTPIAHGMSKNRLHKN